MASQAPADILSKLPHVGDAPKPTNGTPPPAAKPGTPEEERAKKRAAYAAELELAAKKSEEERLVHEDLVLELRARFTREIGPQGRDWELVNEENVGGEGPIVVKMQAAEQAGPQHKRWMAADSSIESMTQYVLPSIAYPDVAKFAVIASRRAGLVSRATAALNKLFGDRQADINRKF